MMRHAHGAKAAPDTANGRFALVLSGGAALGAAHLGVIDWLDEHGLEPWEIAGTSMGAIVGALKAIGLGRQERNELFSAFSSRSKWVRPSMSQPALLDTQTLRGVFAQVFEDRTMADTRIPLKVTATDFDSGSLRVFSRDDAISMVEAVLCSMSIPGLFPPVELDGRQYVDGFITANLPLRQVSPSLPTIAVDVLSKRVLKAPQPAAGSLHRRPGQLFDAWERTLLLLLQAQTRAALAVRRDVRLVRPRLAGFRMHQFDQWQAISQLGYEAAADSLGKP